MTQLCLDDINSVAIHRAIYAGRPDVGAIVHGSTPYARAFAVRGCELKMIVQGDRLRYHQRVQATNKTSPSNKDSCTFYHRIHPLPFTASLEAADNPKVIQACLKDGKGLIMQNRGVLVVGATIECPISYYIRMESLCRAQMLAEAAAKGRGGAELVLVGQKEIEVSLTCS